MTTFNCEAVHELWFKNKGKAELFPLVIEPLNGTNHNAIGKLRKVLSDLIIFLMSTNNNTCRLLDSFNLR